MSTQEFTLRNEKDFLEDGYAAIRTSMLDAIARNGACIIGLSGGKTPGAMYAKLGGDASIDWKNVHVFLCDERYVPADHADSNQRMLNETLLRATPIPSENVHVPDTSLPLPACIAAYDEEIKTLLQNPADIVVLGMGPDGHTASLFPPLPDEAFGPAYVIHTETDAFAVHDRISVALPVLTNARDRILLLRGKDKIETWQQMTSDDADERRWPLKAVMKRGSLDVIIAE